MADSGGIRSLGGFQLAAGLWALNAFGPDSAGDVKNRSHRFLEEALELVQACGCTGEEAGQLVEYVYSRPAGAIVQETGGAMVTLAALSVANHLDMVQAGGLELRRCRDNLEGIRAKEATRAKNSALPGNLEGGG